MTALFQPDRHIAPSNAAWCEEEARAAIREIADDAFAHKEAQGLWPVHPLDGLPGPVAGLYMGASGIIWALDDLARAGAIERTGDWAALMPALAAHDAGPLEQAGLGARASLLIGDLGPLLLTMRIAPDLTVADRLLARITSNDSLPPLELMWGSPGSMLACLFMHRMTGEARFAAEYRTQAARLIGDLDRADGYDIWTQEIFPGQRKRYLGLVHGFAGNMAALVRGWEWLEAQQQERVAQVARRTLEATAIRAGDAANWPTDMLNAQAPLLCQICHGAPGIVVGLADAPFSSPEFEALLAAGGALIRAAGPLAKGANLCHGTAGNGYALLKLFKRTGDASWLEDARRFAMTAIEQVHAARRTFGEGRYSLWTGDIGVALYLWDCIRAEPAFPTVDVF